MTVKELKEMTPEQTETEMLDLQHLLRVLQALRDGDLSQRMPAGQTGIAGEIAATINATCDQLRAVASEISRIAREIGEEGKFGGQACPGGVSGSWKAVTDNVNAMAWTLTDQIRDMANATHSLTNGGPFRRVTVNAGLEMLLLKEYINVVGDHLSSRSSP